MDNVVQIAAIATATIVATEAAVDLWDSFWTLYPRHEAKKDARKAWEHLKEHERYAAVVAIADWRVIWKHQGRDESTTPLAATWLRGERWEDEIPTGLIARKQEGLSAVAGQANLPVSSARSAIPTHVQSMIDQLKAKART